MEAIGVTFEGSPSEEESGATGLLGVCFLLLFFLLEVMARWGRGLEMKRGSFSSESVYTLKTCG